MTTLFPHSPKTHRRVIGKSMDPTSETKVSCVGTLIPPPSYHPYFCDPSVEVADWFRAIFLERSRSMGPIGPFLYERLFGPAERLYRQILDSSLPFFPAASEVLRFSYECSDRELKQVPKDGPAILVANHPHGLIESVLLGTILHDMGRRDFRILGTPAAMCIRPVREFLIPIYPPESAGAEDANRESYRAAIRWSHSGGILVVFPSGYWAKRTFPRFKHTEQPWDDSAALLARWSGAPVVPVFIHGANHGLFYAVDFIHHNLQYVALGMETLRRQRRVIRVSLGSPILSRPLIDKGGLALATSYYRARTLAMSGRARTGEQFSGDEPECLCSRSTAARKTSI